MGLYGYKAEIIDMSVGRLYHSYVAAWEATKGYPHKRKNSHEFAIRILVAIREQKGFCKFEAISMDVS